MFLVHNEALCIIYVCSLCILKRRRARRLPLSSLVWERSHDYILPPTLPNVMTGQPWGY